MVAAPDILDDLPLIPLDIIALKQRAAMPISLGSSVKRARRKLFILERDAFRCKQCGSTKLLTIDHIGWNDAYKNRNATSYDPLFCQTLCVWCHRKKTQQQNQLRRQL